MILKYTFVVLYTWYYPGQYPRNSRGMFREEFFSLPVPVRISFRHPSCSRRNLGFPFPSKQFLPWKCLISVVFRFRDANFPWKYRFPKSVQTETVEKSVIHAGMIPASSACTGSGSPRTPNDATSTRHHQVRMYDML